MSALVDLIRLPMWCAWRNEQRGGKITKIPYFGPGLQAKADTPGTWQQHDTAAELVKTVVNGIGGGVGIFLGTCGDNQWLAGFDLDACRRPDTGELDEWAREVLDRFNTYAEISPSKTGVKAYFWIDPADIAALRTIMTTQHGRSWKRINGQDHPPAIELHISNRYFAVTWDTVDDTAELRLVAFDDLKWLVEEAGPAFAGKPNPRPRQEHQDHTETSDNILGRLNTAAHHNRALAEALIHASTMRGGSRSEGPFGLGAALKRAGWSFTDMKAALLACPATKEWTNEKQFSEGDRWAERIWDNTTTETPPKPNVTPEPELKPSIWIDADDWDEATIPRRPWVVPGYAHRGAVSLIAGPPSAMKSSLSLGWALSVTLHRDYGRFHPAVSGPVIVYNVEDDIFEQRRRLSAALRQFGATPASLKDKLFRIGPSTIGTLLERGDDGKVRFTAAMDKLHELISASRPVMLIVDPLSELHSCEENDNTALRAVIATFREVAARFDMSVVILHHTRKGAGQSPGDADSARGASAIIGAVRVAVTLTTMSEDDAKAFGMPIELEARSNYVRMDDAKSNYAPLRAAQWFEKVAYELANGDIVPAAVPWAPPEAKVASLSDLTALAVAIERGSPCGQPWSPRLSNEPRSVRGLLDQHGFRGSDAQKAVVTRLETECGVTIATYRRPSNRSKASGLRIDAKPKADWIDLPQPEPTDDD